MSKSTRINMVVAHAAEAKPLCALFELRAQATNSPFPLFQNESGLCLIVSGMGKLAAASATGYLAALSSGIPSAWLNIGIAGHHNAAIGTGLLAHKITDASSSLNYYPPQVIKGLLTSAVVTVDTPEHNYPVQAAYDMEAAGFYASATRYSTSELVHAFKIISDNSEQSLDKFDVSQVKSLISDQSEQLQLLVRELDALLEQYLQPMRLPDAHNTLLQRYHWTASQQVQLKRLCERCMALSLHARLDELSQQNFASSKQVVSELSSLLATQEYA